MTMTISSAPNYSLVNQLAEKVLLSIETPVLPIKIMPIVNSLCDNGLIVNTFEQYVKNENINYEEFIKKNRSKDGTLRYFPNDNSFTLLYNKNVQRERKTWTIAHELGHYYANHPIKILQYAKEHDIDPQELPEEIDTALEQEANCFARELLVPTSLLLLVMGHMRVFDFVGVYTILRALFRVSQEASYYITTDIVEFKFPPRYSEKICFKYASSINSRFFNVVKNYDGFYALQKRYQNEIDPRDYMRRMMLNTIAFNYS